MRAQKFIKLILALLPLLGAGNRCLADGAEGDLPLVAPLNLSYFTNISTTDATVSLSGSGEHAVLHVATGHTAKSPGLTLAAPNGHWDLMLCAEIMAFVKNVGSNPVTLSCRVDNPGADGRNHCVNGDVTLAPGQSDNLCVELKRTSGDQLEGKLFGMRGYPVLLGGPGTVDPANVTQILLFVAEPSDEHVFEVSNLRASGRYTPPTAWTSDATPFFPFIDTFGQYRHKDWPGKTKSLADLAGKRHAEAAELASMPGPKEWDKYGGWSSGPLFQTDGFFRTQKFNGKWWLVDPDGHLFFSHGIDCVGYDEPTPITGRETWFQDFPGHRPEFEGFFTQGHGVMGYYDGKTFACFSFLEANLLRKYGPEWKTIYTALTHQRLRSWGVNTICNWSDSGIKALHRTPFTECIGSDGTRMIEGSSGYWGKFPDVFDPSFEQRLESASHHVPCAGDPWCLGYFCDNELSWGDDTSIAAAALKSSADQPAKKVFVANLKAKYGEIAKLNAAWGTNIKSWEALLQGRVEPDLVRARDDLTGFYTIAAERYFRIARDALKAAAPHQLFLGCRINWGNPLTAAAAAKYCDVVSYNIYKRSVADYVIPGGADVPLLVGEFHFGALDRGLFHPGLVELPNQTARAQAYRDYVEGALHHPQFVGCHWFQFHDQPVLGRAGDEENYQIGFLDVADTPYVETIAAVRSVGYNLYK